ncbi:TBC1 domain family member 5-like isoform X2 [Anneissia japonica]|uniref:TBC1 domain family member 5-like isoform X2 n=1 Tax=Anneissia japonica TaxID=1529436 RepID=UPI0014255426|nr:TBC1 domain family member 5-like isoform X2 [Anneissia japonica]
MATTEIRKGTTYDEIMQSLEMYGNQGNDRLVREYSQQDALVVEDVVTNGNGDQEIRSRSTSTSYKEEWQWLFERDDYLRVIRCEGVRGRLRSSRFRSVCWKVYLECLPHDKSQWLTAVRKWRSEYEELREKHVTNPHNKNGGIHSPDPVLHHPLSQEKDSVWNKYFEDTELRQLIKQDVMRTFPEIQFFQSEDVRSMMIDMLFCYAREHQSICYKQGMHELLAPMIFVLHCDHQAFIHAQEIESQLDDVTEVLDPAYIEHDAYCMFTQLMETMEPSYRHGRDEFMSRAKHKFDKPLFKKSDECATSTPIVLRLTRVQEVILKQQDFQLYQHLSRLEIKPQIYGIRWVRLLFGREVILQDLLVLWDAIFSDSATLDLVDYIFVAMLILVRELLITSDYAKCMTILMRFPPVGDVHFLINKALHLRDPTKYARPSNYQFQVLSTLQGNRATSQNGKQIQNLKNKTTAVVTSGFNSLKRITAKGRVGENRKFQKAKSDPTDLTEGTPHPLGGPSDGIAVTTRPLNTAKPTSTKGGASTNPTPMNSLTPAGTPVDDTPKPIAKSTPPLKIKSKKNHTREEYDELDQQVRHLQGRLNDMHALRRYCASKMEAHLMQMQDELLKHGNDGTEDELLLSIAGLKQVKDILNGTLRFSQGITDDEEVEININENHYGGPSHRLKSVKHTDESRETSVEDKNGNDNVEYASSNTDDQMSLNSNQNSSTSPPCFTEDGVISKSDSDEDEDSEPVNIDDLGDDDGVEIIGGILSFEDDIASSRSDATNIERTIQRN